MIIDEENGVYTISAEVFGKGIDIWLRSQGDVVKVIESQGKEKGCVLNINASV